MQQQSSSINTCSLNDALNQVDQNLIYDPITKKLCLKNVDKSISNHYSDSRKSQQHIASIDNDLNKCAKNDCPSNKVNNFDDEIDSMINIAKFLNLSDENILYNEYLIKNDIIINIGKNINDIKRPKNLPPKNKSEERKHRQQFLNMLMNIQAKHLQCKKLRNEFVKKKLQYENEVQKAIKIWSDEILPCWRQSHITKRVQNLWWNGIPSSIRPKVWSLVIGNELNITEQLFNICLNKSKEKIWLQQQQYTSLNGNNNNQNKKQQMHLRSKSYLSSSLSSDISSTQSSTDQSIIDNKIKENDDSDSCILDDDEYFHNEDNENDYDDDDSENTAFLIKLDVLRTFPQLGLFQEQGPYHRLLCDIISAYVAYRPDIGYCQGMSFLAAMLLLNSQSPLSAFISLANLLNNKLLIIFYSFNQTKMNMIYNYYDRQFKLLLPDLAAHFTKINLTTDLFFMYQVYTLFARSLSLDCVSRVWDLFLRDGNEFIIRASLGILLMYKNELMQLEFIDSAKFLSKLPDDMDIDKYFDIIATIKLIPPDLSTLLQNDQFNDNDLSNLNNQHSNVEKSRYTLFVNKFWRF